MRVPTRVLLLAATLAVLAQGCTDAPTAPAAAPPPTGTAISRAQSGSLDPIARFRRRPSVPEGFARKWIGPDGGRLEFHGFAVDVPRGALPRWTPVTIRLPDDPTGAAHVIAEFGPHGTRFRRPVRLTFPLRGTTIEGSPSPSVVWWDGQWVDVGGQVTGGGSRLETWTDHFSEYGTTDSRAGHTVSTSGG